MFLKEVSHAHKGCINLQLKITGLLLLLLFEYILKCCFFLFDGKA